jgi:hypothetical protein
MGKGKLLLSNCTVYEPCVIVHGGAWAIPDDLKSITLDGVQQAARAGYDILLKVIITHYSFSLFNS